MMGKCSAKNVKFFPIDTACLDIVNVDSSNVLEFWAQSEECLECSAWKYTTLKPNQKFSLKVNTTYPTNMYLRHPFQYSNLDRLQYHYIQHGWYELNISTSGLSQVAIKFPGASEIPYAYGLIALLFCIFILYRPVAYLHRKIWQRFYAEVTDEDEGLVPDIQEQEVELEVEAVQPRFPRLQSIDTFRGISIILMIFVNYGGGKFYFFRHSIWNGLTVADLVFPWFLWILGFCVVWSVQSQLCDVNRRKLMPKRIITRCLKLILLSFILSGRSVYLEELRILGVLQRICICYSLYAMLECINIKIQPSTQVRAVGMFRDMRASWLPWLITTLLVMVNLTLTFFLEVPGCPKGYLGPGGLHMNSSYVGCTGGAAGYIDRLIMGEQHMYQHVTCHKIYDNSTRFDPEGILSTLMACLTVQLGAAAARIMIAFPGHVQRVGRFLVWHSILAILGGILCGWSKEGGVIPVNKNLWSLSYVCVTCSFAFLLYGLLYLFEDVFKRNEFKIMTAAGCNAILLYVGHEVMRDYVPWGIRVHQPTHFHLLVLDCFGTFAWMMFAYYLFRTGQRFLL